MHLEILMRKFLIGAAFTALLVASPALAATTIFESTFENESPTRTSGFTTVNSTGVWTKESGTAGIELQFGSTGGATAGPGNRVKVELDSLSNSGMFYTFLENGIYTLEFLFSPRANVLPSSNSISVLVNEIVLGTFTGGPNSTTVWTQQSVGPFTGLTGQRLVFRATGTSDSLGGYVDNIKLARVSAIPEPTTWAMFILGLGLVGFSMRRRQRISTRVSFA